MFEGKHVRWGIDSANQQAELILLHSTYTRDDILTLIEELMSVRNRLLYAKPLGELG